jgi:hypothetical protein
MKAKSLYGSLAVSTLLFLVLAWFPLTVMAQTIRDDVKDFVEENLEGDKDKKDKTEEDKKKGQQGKGKGQGTTAVTAKPPDKKGGATAPVKAGTQKPVQGKAAGTVQAKSFSSTSRRAAATAVGRPSSTPR